VAPNSSVIDPVVSLDSLDCTRRQVFLRDFEAHRCGVLGKLALHPEIENRGASSTDVSARLALNEPTRLMWAHLRCRGRDFKVRCLYLLTQESQETLCDDMLAAQIGTGEQFPLRIGNA
jgi:hypothetical protein